MTRIIVATVLSLALFACAAPQSEVSQRQQEMLNPTVRVEMADQKGSGSGTVIRSDKRGTFLVTNHHVAGERGTPVQVRVWLLNGKGETVLSIVRDAEVVASDPDRDLALLHLSDSELRLPTATFAPHDVVLQPGEEVFVSGAALGLRAHLTQGLLSLLSHNILKRDHLVTSAPVVPGNSGGGVYHRAPSGRFEYIGTVQAVAIVGFGSVVPTTNYAIPNSDLREFLNLNGYAWVIA